MSSKTLANQFRSTYVYGTFNNMDNTSNNIQAQAAFQRDVHIGTNLFLGKGEKDDSGDFLDSTANIQFTLNKEIVSIPATSLKYLKNVTSDIQQQINNINNDGGEQSSTFTNLTVTGSINDLVLKNYGNSNTSFSTGNTLIFGNNNTRFGYFTGLLSGYSNAVFGDQSLQNCTGHSNTAIGHNSQNGNTSYNWNTSVGSNSNITGGSSNIAIGHVAQCSNCTNSIVIGNSITCTTNNQILLGNSSHSVSIPGDLTSNGLLSANRLTTSGDLTSNGLLSANRLTTSGDLTCNGLFSANRSSTGYITFSESLNNISTSTFSYLSGVSSGIQDQLNTASTAINALNAKTIDISWIAGAVNRTDIRNACSTHTLTFSNSLNSISTTTFSYLSGLTSNIQQQINAISTLPGTVIAFAGSSSSVSGYLLCDGSIYNSQNYNALFNAIGTIYGDAGNGNFRVPNYKGIFLRGAGQQDVQLNVIAGGGGAIFKNFQAPDLGKTVSDQSAYFSTGNYVDNITTQTRTVVTGSPLLLNNYSTANVISGLSYTTTNNSYHFGNPDVHPAHASVQYFIKY